MLFSLLCLRKGKVLKLISWKHSFKRLNEEYEIAKKKKQALDNLFENGRISQATRDSFDSDINAVIIEIEKQQNALLTKMQAKTQELESQIKTLETLLANYEIQHVVGEIDEDMYQREMTVLSTSLESARHELNVINEATNQLCPPVEEVTTESDLAVEENVDAIQNEPEESVIEAPAEMEAPAEPYVPEPAVTMEESTPEAPSIESENITPEETPQIVEETPEITENPPEISEEMPQTNDYAAQETEWQPQVTEDTPQEMNETPEIAEEAAEITEDLSQAEVVEASAENAEEAWQPAEEEVPQVSEEISQETQENEYQPETDQETLESVNEAPEMTDDTEITEEYSQNIETEVVEESAENAEEAWQPAEEEVPQMNEPQTPDEPLQTVEETSDGVNPSEAPKEAPQEISVEVIADDEQDEAENTEAAESDDETEYEEL